MIRWNLILLLFFAFPFWIFAKKPSPHLDEHWNIFKVIKSIRYYKTKKPEFQKNKLRLRPDSYV